MLSKEELRRQIRETKRQFTPLQLAELSRPVVEKLRQRLTEAQTIVAYYPLPDEVDIRNLIDDLVAMGKMVLLPKVIDAGQMEIRRYTCADDLREGEYHLMEPVGEPFTRYDLIDIALIPGMAFDAKGHRLGRGRGYYDRFLVNHAPFATIGVCFDFQKVAEVPVGPMDIPVDEVV
ncbi:MAG: 5-formyltetrahydrofolate cyclo-ligase [Prevotella sp.]|nr:5-formyltetrahydrofolate cyclo-ligase [Prevotella sp.]